MNVNEANKVALNSQNIADFSSVFNIINMILTASSTDEISK